MVGQRRLFSSRDGRGGVLRNKHLERPCVAVRTECTGTARAMLGASRRLGGIIVGCFIPFTISAQLGRRHAGEVSPSSHTRRTSRGASDTDTQNN